MTTYRDEAGAAALAAARRLTGDPYIYGGTYPADGGTDCAGLTQWAWGQIGVRLPRTSEAQAPEYPVNDRSEPNQVGDLLFITGDPIDPNPGHVVFYVAPGECFEALETGVRIGQYPFATEAWEFRTRPALACPVRPALPPAKGHPTAAQLSRSGLVVLANPTEAHEAVVNGWPLFYWASTWFHTQEDGKPTGVALYASNHWREKR